jgi:hypothetical protein
MENTLKIDGLLIDMMALLSDLQESHFNDGSQWNNKIYCWIEDDILAVKIAYFGDLSDDSTRAGEIQADGEKIDYLQAFDLLASRIKNTISLIQYRAL